MNVNKSINPLIDEANSEVKLYKSKDLTNELGQTKLNEKQKQTKKTQNK